MHSDLLESFMMLLSFHNNRDETRYDFRSFSEGHVKTTELWPPLIKNLLSSFHWEIPEEANTYVCMNGAGGVGDEHMTEGAEWDEW